LFSFLLGEVDAVEDAQTQESVAAAAWDVTVSDGVLVARYRNPPLNYLTGVALGRLAELVEQWADPEVRAFVLAGGEPGTFITHFSVEELLAGQERMASRGPELNYRVHATFQALNDLAKPVICALNGDTMGVGFELALSCDLRIGERGDYRYGLPEVRLGLIPGGTGTQRLTRLIGQGAALNLLMRARVVPPQEALELGLVHELADDAVAAATELAGRLAEFPPTALATVKRIVYQAGDLPLPTALRMEADASFRAKVSPESTAAMERYLALPLESRRDWLLEGAK
jgi:enoyl-CoA hydratase/carnithine racemase